MNIAPANFILLIVCPPDVLRRQSLRELFLLKYDESAYRTFRLTNQIIHLPHLLNPFTLHFC
jgi:hypothetical protein